MIAVVDDAALTSLPDEEILVAATTAGRAVVTANIKDFVPLDAGYKAAQRRHAGLVLISSKTFPQDRSLKGALVTALDGLLLQAVLRPDALIFLERAPE